MLNNHRSVYADGIEAREARLLDDFEGALRNGQFVVHYQPKYDIRPEEPRLCGAEALVRWAHPELGLLNPEEFLPLLEREGLIRALDGFVRREVCAQLADWKARRGACPPVSVNVSAADLRGGDFAGEMWTLTAEFGLEPGDLGLEITEDAYAGDAAGVIETAEKLRDLGFRVELDDFGAGCSSLNMLFALPIDDLKLDARFIHDAFDGRRDTRMPEIVLNIANALMVPAVAEGVETAEQVFTLKALGCDIAQGFYFSKPVPAGEYEALLSARQPVIDLPAAPKPRQRSSDRTSSFPYDALHDPQTGLYNNSACEMLLMDANKEHIALMIARLPDYERIRDGYGRVTADRVVARVAEALRDQFRSVDFVCRISNDEFAVIVTRIQKAMRQLIENKVARINAMLNAPFGDLPPVALSVGVAFGDRDNPEGDIFHDADIALNRLKDQGRTGCAVF